ncbi:MAG: hypothetical protein ACK526_18525, partial [Planctomyces sp.]
GNSLNNSLSGSGVTDTINGLSGNDTLIGGQGDDTYTFSVPTAAELDVITENAAEGNDTVNFAAITSAVTFNLGLTTAQGVHTNRTLTLSSATGIDSVTGGTQGDTLTGNTLNNSISGGGGSDTINGLGGNDTLIGGIGDDRYVFATAAAAEADSVTENTGEGTDTLDFSALATGVILNINNNAIQNVHTNRTLKLNSFSTFENVIGGTAGDSLTGNSLNNTLTGSGGPDTLNGFTGNDTLIGGQGDDTYTFSVPTAAEADVITENAAEGTDTISFAAITTAVALDLGIATVQAVHLNRTLTLSSATGIENAIGGSGNDVLRGNTLGNSLTGNNGNDILVGLNGNDTLTGGIGNDILVGGRGLDSLNGSQGEDLLIAGYTLSAAVEDSATFLTTLSTTWFGAGAFAARQAALTPVLVPASTVINDADVDTLTANGDAALDWLFAALIDSVLKDAGDVTTTI